MLRLPLTCIVVLGLFFGLVETAPCDCVEEYRTEDGVVIPVDPCSESRTPDMGDKIVLYLLDDVITLPDNADSAIYKDCDVDDELEYYLIQAKATHVKRLFGGIAALNREKGEGMDEIYVVAFANSIDISRHCCPNV